MISLNIRYTIIQLYHYSKFITSLFQDWSIRIIRLSTSDSGLYKCQANSHPPQFITVNLFVDGKLFLSLYNPHIDNITFFVI